MTDYTKFLSPTGRQLTESAIRRMGTVVARTSDMVSFAPGYPDASLFPWQELREISAGLLDGHDADTLQYGPTRGYRPLLETALSVLEQRAVHAHLEQLIVTSGSQQGIDLIARVLVSPGDVVLVELPTFTGAIAAFKNMQAELRGVRLEDDGISLEHLDDVWQHATNAGRAVKLLYLVPNFQNPTGITLSAERRQVLARIAAEHKLVIMEDDPYGKLRYRGTEIPPIKHWDEAGQVLYASTFSKTIAPGLRLGWVVAPPEVFSRLLILKQEKCWKDRSKHLNQPIE